MDRQSLRHFVAAYEAAFPREVVRIHDTVSLEHDVTVSRVHAVLENLGQAWSIRDVGSRNGTFVNGRRVTENLLKDGWRVRLGEVEFIFHEGNL